MASASTTPPPPSSLVPTVTPASLSSFAIYNPSLGSTDETLHDQLVFYTSRDRRAASANDRLRQIGLAQGVTEFSRGFSPTPPPPAWTSIDTAKSRIVTTELESGWWVLAQVDLTYIHNPTVSPATSEYSSREVSPPPLLLAQIRKAYSLFRLHYGTFQGNWEKLGRYAFCKRVEKYWLRWCWRRWEVMMAGNPAVDMLLGGDRIKMAGGRAGREIAEQQSEFFEGWGRKEKTRGLVDMVVCRFGEPEKEADEKQEATEKPGRSGLWFWPSGSTTESGKQAQEAPPVLMPTDGCIFRGIGALDTRSVADITSYLADLYEKGDDTHNASAGGTRRRTRKRPQAMAASRRVSSTESSPRRSTSTVRNPRGSSDTLKRTGSNLRRVEPETAVLEDLRHLEPAPASEEPGEQYPSEEETATTKQRTVNRKILNMLTFGWSTRIPGLSRSSAPPSVSGDVAPSESAQSETEATTSAEQRVSKKKGGVFLIGFQGDLDIEDIDDDHDDSVGRITSRSVWASLSQETPTTNEGGNLSEDEESTSHSTDLQEFKIAIYTNKPYIFALLFTSTARVLSSPSFYRSIHHQLTPVIHSLPTPPTISKPPYDLLVSHNVSTLYTTLPPIPEPGLETPGWTRTDALHLYTILLGMLQERNDLSSKERTARSARGWWVSWRKLDDGEGILVRRAGEKRSGEVESRDVKQYFQSLMGRS